MIIIRKKLLEKSCNPKFILKEEMQMRLNKVEVEMRLSKGEVEREKMDKVTSVYISRAFKKCWDVTISLLEIRDMVLLPPLSKKEDSTEIYAICSKDIQPEKGERMYVAKVYRNQEAEIEKVLVAIQPPLLEAAREWKEKQEKKKK